MYNDEHKMSIQINCSCYSNDVDPCFAIVGLSLNKDAEVHFNIQFRSKPQTYVILTNCDDQLVSNVQWLQVNVLWELCPVESSVPASPIDDPRRQTDAVRSRLVCVLDASLSMRESYGPDERLSKIDRVKIFVQLLVKTMSSDDWLGIVTFGTDARVVLPLQRLTEEVKVNSL